MSLINECLTFRSGLTVSGFIIYFLCLPSKESNKENSGMLQGEVEV